MAASRVGSRRLSGDAGLLERSLATLVGSWAYLAGGSPGAEILEVGSATVAAFVHAPDRDFLNNTLLAPGLGDLGPTLGSVERAYAERGIERFAIWVHESDPAAVEAITGYGYRHDTSTLAMAMRADDFVPADTSVLDLAEPDLAEFWRVAEVEGLGPELRPDGAHFYLSRFQGTASATLMALDHDRDCGIFIVGTAPHARRQGIATALSAHALREAFGRGCRTASLQATPMAEAVYRRVGFRDLGRFDEFVLER